MNKIFQKTNEMINNIYKTIFYIYNNKNQPNE